MTCEGRFVMPSRIDIKGQRFGRLLVLRKAPSRNRHTYWSCCCDCGTELEVRTDALTRGPTVSCGCYQNDVATKHGMYKSKEYNTWKSMLMRCENPNAQGYKNYGERGIKVCRRWHDFEAFYQDMGPRPSGSSLDRIDNGGDYEPSNCRWTTAKKQGRNRRDNVYLVYKGETRCIAGWAEKAGIKYSCLKERLNRGWSVEEAIETPVSLSNRWRHQREK